MSTDVPFLKASTIPSSFLTYFKSTINVYADATKDYHQMQQSAKKHGHIFTHMSSQIVELKKKQQKDIPHSPTGPALDQIVRAGSKEARVAGRRVVSLKARHDRRVT